MALTPESNEAFFREVDEEMRRDQLASFGKRWGVLIAVLVVLAIAGAGGWFYWQHHKQAQAGAEGARFDTAMQAMGKDKPDDATAPLGQLAASDRVGYRAMAKFTQADILLKKDDLKGAAAKFAEIANDDTLPQPYRDLATIRRTAAEFDTMKPDAVVQRLRALANKESPWFGSAGEMVAIAYLRGGRRDLAGKLYSQLASADGVPDSIRQRAVQMAGILGSGSDTDDGTPASGDDKTADMKEKKAG